MLEVSDLSAVIAAVRQAGQVYSAAVNVECSFLPSEETSPEYETAKRAREQASDEKEKLLDLLIEAQPRTAAELAAKAALLFEEVYLAQFPSGEAPAKPETLDALALWALVRDTGLLTLSPSAESARNFDTGRPTSGAHAR